MTTGSLWLTYQFSFSTVAECRKPPQALAQASDWDLLVWCAQDYCFCISCKPSMARYVPEWWVDVRNGPLESPIKASGAKARKPSVSPFCSTSCVHSGTHLSHIYPCCMNSLYHTHWHLAAHCTLKAVQLSSNRVWILFPSLHRQLGLFPARSMLWLWMILKILRLWGSSLHFNNNIHAKYILDLQSVLFSMSELVGKLVSTLNFWQQACMDGPWK